MDTAPAMVFRTISIGSNSVVINTSTLGSKPLGHFFTDSWKTSRFSGNPQVNRIKTKRSKAKCNSAQKKTTDINEFEKVFKQRLAAPRQMRYLKAAIKAQANRICRLTRFLLIEASSPTNSIAPEIAHSVWLERIWWAQAAQ